MTEPPTGNVTFFFTDIQGSTAMWERDPVAMQSALSRHDAILKGSIEERGGYVFKTVGDAFCAAFPTATGALEAALAAQRALYAEEWERDRVIRARMALHTGAIEERGGDYFGPPVNRVARLLSAGHGGQTLLSLATQELVRDGLPGGASLIDLGERRLKDLFRPERVFQLLAPDLPQEFPPLRTLESRRNNLPLQPTPLVGRERAVEEVCERLRQRDVRLLTLTGPGGTGKTRLSLQAGADLLEDFEHGVCFVELATETDPELIVSEVAGALGLRESGDVALQDLLKEYLSRRELLLILDNFEQLLEAAPLAGELLSAAPGVKVLATSRIPLRLYGEHEYAVPPLSVPDPRRLPPVAVLSQYEAVRLFIERAGAAKAGFEITNENVPAIAEICVRLDGLPLAIELAAARIKLLPPKALLTRLANRLKILTGGAKDLPARQRTLRGAIEWSYDLLDEGEKTLFARLSAFSGGRTLEAVEAVCDAEGDPPIDSFEGVSSLLDKSLLRQEEDLQDEPRFVMLETIHEFAREKLEESGEAEAIKRAHAEYFLAVAEEAEPELVGPDQVAWLDRLEAEHDNLQAALSWSLAGGEIELGLRLAGALWWFWNLRCHWREGRRWYEEGLQRAGKVPQLVRAKALLGAGVLMYKLGDHELSAERIESSLDLYRQAGGRQGAATCLGFLGTIALDLGDLERAEALLEESLTLARESGSRWDICITLGELSYVASVRGDLERAKILAEESLALAREIGDTRSAAAVNNTLALTAMLDGDYERAQTLFEESLELVQTLRQREYEATALHNLGLVSLARGDHARAASLSSKSLRLSEELLDHVAVTYPLDVLAAIFSERGEVRKAARLWGAAEALREDIGIPQPPEDKRVLEPFLEAARCRLDEAVFEAAWEEGRAMTEEQAIALALQEDIGERAAEAEPA